MSSPIQGGIVANVAASTVKVATPSPIQGGIVASGVPTVTVTNPTTLWAAMKVAKPGEIIKLAPGTYSGMTLSGLHFASAITLTSLDPNHPAVISGLKVANMSGVNFTNMELTTVGSTDPYYAFRVQSSSNISFSHMVVQGNLAATPLNQLNGFYIVASSNVSITNSSFHDLCSAIVANNNTYLTISSNSFDGLNKGGIEMGGSSNVLISNNSFTNFDTSPGVHGDVIQVYTAGITTTAHDITITGNLYDRGSGVAAQGIFMNDESGVGYHNVTISDNTMIGGDWNSIGLKDASGNVNIVDNTIASWTGMDVVKGAPTAYSAWIYLTGNMTGAHITETGNKAQVYLNSAGHAEATPAGNSVLGGVTDGGASLLHAWASANPTHVSSLSGDLLTLLGVHTASISGIA